MAYGQIEFALLINAMLHKQADTTKLTIDSAIDWNLFYKLVLRHRVWHQVSKALMHQPTTPITNTLTTWCKRDKLYIFTMATETVRIARYFQNNSIDHCFVKGTLLNVHVYDGLDTRPCRDIDVLVNTDHYAHAERGLLALGYQKKLPAYELKGFKKTYYMQHKHDMAFYHPGLKILVELHFNLGYFGLNFFPFPAIERSSIQLFNTNVQAPSDDYHVLYLMLHGAVHAWNRLRWLQDIAVFIERDKCDLNRIMALATQINCQHIVEQTLILITTLFGISTPMLIRWITTPSQRARKLATMALAFITANNDMTGGIMNITLFVKYRFYIASLAHRGQKTRVIVRDLFKIDELFMYVTIPTRLSFMYYMLYPLWVIKYVYTSIRAQVR